MAQWEDQLVIESLSLGATRVSRGGVYKANCPSCQETKHRLFFLWNSGKDRTNVYCHNCGYARSLRNFIKEFYPDVLPETHFSGIKSRKRIIERTFAQQVIANHKQERIRLVSQKQHPKNCVMVEHLPLNHKALKYVKDRKIPSRHYQNMYYCSNFKNLAKSYGYNVTKWIDEDRLVIPFWDKNKRISYLQGRSFDPETKMRYITLECSRNALKIWGLDSVRMDERIYITEGPIDGMFLKNSLAMGGSKVSDARLMELLGNPNPRDVVFVYDNEPNNIEIVKCMEDKIRFGFSIVLWDRMKVKSKDINDAVLEGFDINNISKMIVSGNTAVIKLKRWRF